MTQHDTTELVIHAVRQTRNVKEREESLVIHARDLANALDECAAGPWRTDVENAPKDGSEIIGKFRYCGNEVRDFCVWHHTLWASHSTIYLPDTLLAFAIPNPNPPEVKS